MSPRKRYDDSDEYMDDDYADELEPRAPRRNRLYKNPRKGKICGVCAGIAEYYGFDVTVVRVVTVIGAFIFSPWVLIAYCLAAWLLPRKPRELYKNKKEDRFWRDVRVKPSETAKGLAFKFKDMERRIGQMETHITSREVQLRREFKNL